MPFSRHEEGSGRIAPAPFLFLFAVALANAGPVHGQGAPARPVAPPPAPQSQQGVPDTLLASKLIWSTMAAVDHGNLTGNYSVLRDLGAPGFQANNNAATLAGVFAPIRDSRVDLSNTLLLAPTLDFAPVIVQGGLLRLRGTFQLRPTGAAFDLLYQNVGGSWRLFGVAVVPFQMGAVQGTPARR